MTKLSVSSDDRLRDEFRHFAVVLEREDEPNHAQAMKLQEALLADQIEIRLPTFWRYEVGNVLGLKKPGMAMKWSQQPFLPCITTEILISGAMEND